MRHNSHAGKSAYYPLVTHLSPLSAFPHTKTVLLN